MLELKALLLTQGMHGMVSQVEGLAKALKLNFKHQKIKLKPFWNLIPPKLTPISENLLTEKFVCDSKIVISCGRKSVISSIALKKRLGKEIFNIHIQDPKVSFKYFDLIISPKHDNINGDNVIQTQGSIHYLTKKEISENSKYLQLDKGKKQLVAFIIGGPNRYYDYSDEQIHFIFNKIKTLFTPDKFKIIVIPSYRTPERVIKKAYNTFSVNHNVIKTIDKKAYLCSLSIADYIIVTCDSTSMISEAAVTGKPVYMAMMKANRDTSRFKSFYAQFKDLGIAKELTDSIDNWSYDKLDEVNRIAPLIKEKMKKNGII
ncbi:MAG: nucleoside-diphosphate sugar epimerase [Candidatus Pelagibacter sp. TMED263]|nr:MAG: nucleoside-diphosphate sugar epimerase [Candidatus Pelagibacter sp. TMED263]|tara:strand:- start:1059 stop:2009 length:951 start_codon:yes stop_codon:yes gene_type:complete